jgi:hypothetical protein
MMKEVDKIGPGCCPMTRFIVGHSVFVTGNVGQITYKNRKISEKE